MDRIKIFEIKSTEQMVYKQFFLVGLIEEEEFFRISPSDEANISFPTKDTDDSFTLGVCLNYTIAGVVSFTRDGSEREKLRHKGILLRMYVSKKFRGMNIAKILIEHLLIRVKRVDGIEQVNLTVMSDNHKAINLYTKFGFKSFSTEVKAIKWKGKYYNEDQMVLFLN